MNNVGKRAVGAVGAVVAMALAAGVGCAAPVGAADEAAGAVGVEGAATGPSMPAPAGDEAAAGEAVAQPNMSSDEAWSHVLDLNLGLIKVATGVNVKELPIISSLFPKPEVVDYARIANDVSRIVKQEFVEQNIFGQSSYLNATMTGIRRLAVTQTATDDKLLPFVTRLDDILERTSRPDLRLVAAGYWASAAQTSLGALGLRTTLFPGNVEVKRDLAFSAFEYNEKLLALTADLRMKEEAERGKFVHACVSVLSDEGWGYTFFHDDWDNTDHRTSSDERCEDVRAKYVHDKAENVGRLEKLRPQWMDVTVGALGGDAGVASYHKLLDPKTERAVCGSSGCKLYRVIHNFERWEVGPQAFPQLGTVCRAIDDAAYGSSMEGKFPKDQATRDRLLQEVGCK